MRSLVPSERMENSSVARPCDTAEETAMPTSSVATMMTTSEITPRCFACARVCTAAAVGTGWR